MSRIGKQPIPVPAGVDVTIEGQSISVKGPKGTLGLTVAEPIKVARNDDGAIVVTRPDDERRNRSLHGLSRTLVSNLVTGVTQGYTTKMEIFGVGYRVQLKGSQSGVCAGVQPPGGDRGSRRNHVRRPGTDEVHRFRDRQTKSRPDRRQYPPSSPSRSVQGQGRALRGRADPPQGRKDR